MLISCILHSMTSNSSVIFSYFLFSASRHNSPSDFGGCGEEISMALALVEGAALGTGIRSLLRAVIKASKKLAGFDCILKKLEAILELIKPFIQVMERLNHE